MLINGKTGQEVLAGELLDLNVGGTCTFLAMHTFDYSICVMKFNGDMLWINPNEVSCDILDIDP